MCAVPICNRQANSTVADLLQAFQRSRPSVNPMPGDDRESAVGHVSFASRDVSNDACPVHLCFFKQDFVHGEPPVAVRVCGLPRHSVEHPVLLNPYHTLWALQAWAGHCHVHLPVELRWRVIQLGRFEPTTGADVIRTLAAHVGTPEASVRMVTPDGKLINLASDEASLPLVRLFDHGSSGPFSRSVVQGLHFVLMRGSGSSSGQRIRLQICSQAGNERMFRTTDGTPLIHMMYAFCAGQGVAIGSMRFLFDGGVVRPYETPHDYEMEDGDCIDAMVEICGD